MRKNDLTSTFFGLILIGMTLTACKKDKGICKNQTALTDQHHLLDITPLQQANEFNDTLTKYNQLQVYRIIDDSYLLGMHCNVFYKGLIVFTDHYSLFKSKSNNSVFSSSNYILDTVSFELTPTLTFKNAISIAKKEMNFGSSCVSYRLGIYNLNAGKGGTTKNYKLAWRVAGKNDIPYVVLDANSGAVITSHDGKVN